LFENNHLSLHEVELLHSFFPDKKSYELHEILSNEEETKKQIYQVARSTIKEKNRFWRLFSILPISEKIKKYALEKFTEDQNQPTELSEDTEDIKTIEEVEDSTPIPVKLPLGIKSLNLYI